METREVPVLVVGGGAAGLTIAVTLARYGIECLLVERRHTPSVASAGHHHEHAHDGAAALVGARGGGSRRRRRGRLAHVAVRDAGPGRRRHRAQRGPADARAERADKPDRAGLRAAGPPRVGDVLAPALPRSRPGRARHDAGADREPSGWRPGDRPRQRRRVAGGACALPRRGRRRLQHCARPARRTHARLPGHPRRRDVAVPCPALVAAHGAPLRDLFHRPCRSRGRVPPRRSGRPLGIRVLRPTRRRREGRAEPGADVRADPASPRVSPTCRCGSSASARSPRRRSSPSASATTTCSSSGTRPTASLPAAARV